MARATNAELEALVQRLQAENDSLRAAVTPRKAGRRRGRTVASVALVLIGLVLAPVSVAATWAQSQLADTESFVATFAPLAEEEAVKALVVSEVMAVVEEGVDFETTTSEVFDAVDGLGLPPAASAALQVLKAPAALGLRSLATSAVTGFVESDAFAEIWEQALRVSHRQVVAALTSDPGAALAISGSGELSVQLGPVIDAVKAVMVEQGLGFAEAIPSVDASIVVAQADGFAQLTLLYGLAVGLGTWLPWIALAFLAAGVVAAKRRVVTLFWTGLWLGVEMVLLGIALRIGRLVVVASIAPLYVPVDAAGVIYDTVTARIGDSAVATAVLAFTVAVIAWALGPFRPAPALRRVFGEGATRLRAYGDSRGISTGSFGAFLGRYRLFVEVLVGAAAAAFILLVRPLSTGQTITTALVAIVLILVVELLQRPAADDPIEPDDDDLAGSTVRMEFRG
jgi:hypothetical protein